MTKKVWDDPICSNCFHCLEVPEWKYESGMFCCVECDSCCPKGCYEWTMDTESEKCWQGDILFSKKPLKLGRKKRRRINKLKR